MTEHPTEQMERPMTIDIVNEEQEKNKSFSSEKTLETYTKNNSNAFSINFNKGAFADPVKNKLKSLGGHYRDDIRRWSCPLNSKQDVANLLAENNIKASFKDLPDPYFDKTENEKRAYTLRTQACILRDQLSKGLIPEHGIQSAKDEIDQLETQAKYFESEEHRDTHLIQPGKLHLSVDYAEKVILSNDHGIYQRCGRLVRITRAKTKPNKKNQGSGFSRPEGAIVITEVTVPYLTEFLTKYGQWEKHDARSKKNITCDCPERIAKGLLERKEWGIPVLSGIILAPTLRPDGSILDQPGYDAEMGLLFIAEKTQFEKIPENPTKEDALKSLENVEQVFCKFPFENEESKSVALSAALTALMRKSIATAPLHGFTAPKMGSGKSLLADVVGLIATGKTNAVISHTDNESEERKRLMAVLIDGDPVVCYDNIERPFGSAALCCVLTQREYKDRILGETRNVSAPTDLTFLATGNNLTVVGDTSTRALLCSLDPQVERPEEREFAVNLYEYIPAHRSSLVRHLLTILRAYHIDGRPKQDFKPFGRFEEWSDLIRSAIVWLGCADPCETRKEIEDSDPDRQTLANLLYHWYAAFGDMSFRLKDALSRAEKEQNQELLDVFHDLANTKGGVDLRKLGKKFASFVKRPENGLRLEKMAKYQNAETWRVTKINPNSR